MYVLLSRVRQDQAGADGSRVGAGSREQEERKTEASPG